MFYIYELSATSISRKKRPDGMFGLDNFLVSSSVGREEGSNIPYGR